MWQKTPTSKWVWKAVTRSCHKSHSWHSTLSLGGNPQICFCLRVKDLDHTSIAPTFSSEKQCGSAFMSPPGPHLAKGWFLNGCGQLIGAFIYKEAKTSSIIENMVLVYSVFYHQVENGEMYPYLLEITTKILFFAGVNLL